MRGGVPPGDRSLSHRGRQLAGLELFAGSSDVQTSGRETLVTLPDFRNLGVILRSLVIAEGASLAALVAYAPDGLGALLRFPGSGLLFELTLLAVVLLLFVFSPWLARLRYRSSVWVVAGLAALVAAGLEAGLQSWAGAGTGGGPARSAVLAAMLSGLVLAYFNLRQRVLSPALVEARLIALQSRIRPHFLFNSINTAVSLVRENPRLAEQVLLDLSDLFRASLAGNRLLVPLADEIALARSYLDIEQVRLGERLIVRWRCEAAPVSAMVPAMLLQPLLENAVHHGIEPLAAGGVIDVDVVERKGRVRIEVRNPVDDSGVEIPAGNRIALANIGERLALHFDSEAELRTVHKAGQFVVTVSLPLRISRK